jgi:hypothetical protein
MHSISEQGSDTSDAGDDERAIIARADAKEEAQRQETVERILNTNLTPGRPGGGKQVRVDVLKQFLEEELENQQRCLQFPLIIMYFVAFTLSVNLHEDVGNVGSVERNIRNIITTTKFDGLPVAGHKGMDDIDIEEDVWKWLNEAIVPTFLAQAKRGENRVLRYNQLIGGMQLQQIRRPQRLCAEEYPTLGPINKHTGQNLLIEGFFCYPFDEYDTECFSIANKTLGFCPDNNIVKPVEESDDESTERRRLQGTLRWAGERMFTFGRRLNTARHELGRRLYTARHASNVRGDAWDAIGAGPLGQFHGGIYSLQLHEHEGLATALGTLETLRDNKWLDHGTSWMGVKMFIMNPDLAVFTHAIISIYFPPSGELIPEVTLNSFPAEPYMHKAHIAADVFYFVFWVHLFFRTLARIVYAMVKRELGTWSADIWNWLDATSMVGGFFVLVCWFYFLSLLTSVKEKALIVAGDRPKVENNYVFTTQEGADAYSESTDILHAEVGSLASFLMFYRVCICWYTLLIGMRFFQAFRAQPRLAIVTNTVQASLGDIAHFFIVLTLVFLSYAIAGMFLFGHRLLEFSEFHMAINKCFLLMLGNFNYEELAMEFPFTATLWFLTFEVMVVLVMLNMALAIVMDIYTQVAADAENEDTILSQSAKYVDNAWHRRKWIKLQVLVKHAQSFEQQKVKLVSKDMLMDEIENLSEEQTNLIMNEVESRSEKLDEKGLSMSDAMKMVGWIKLAVQKLGKQVDEIAMLEEEEKELMQASIGVGEGIMGVGEFLSLDPDADLKLKQMQLRLAHIEEFLNESMVTTVNRGKEMRSRMQTIESLLKESQDDYVGGMPFNPITPTSRPAEATSSLWTDLPITALVLPGITGPRRQEQTPSVAAASSSAAGPARTVTFSA